MDSYEARKRLEELRQHQASRAEQGDLIEHPEEARVIEELEYTIFSDPEQQPRVLAWMLDVEGRSSMEEEEVQNIEEKIDDFTPEDIRQFIAKHGGGLFASIEQWFKDKGACITDYGGNTNAWLIGAHCTSVQAWAWYRELWETYDKARKAGLVKFSLKPWSIGFPEDHEPLGEGDQWKSGV